MNPSKLELHSCTVAYVHKDGLINAQSDRNRKFFTNCQAILAGASTSFKRGDRCVILTDGAQHYAIGLLLSNTANKDGGYSSTNPVSDSFNQTPNMSALISRSDMDRQSRVMVSSGGVIIDCEGIPGAHFDPGRNSINQFAERYEIDTIPAKVVMEHDDESCSIKYTFRTVVDREAWTKEMAQQKPEEHLNLGQNINVSIKNDIDVLKIEQKQGQALKSRIILDKDGQISVYSDKDELRYRGHHDDTYDIVDHPAMAKMVHYMFQRVLDTVMDMIMVDAQGKAHSFNDPHVSAYENHNKLLRDSVLSQFTKDFNLEFPYSPQYTNPEERFPPDNPSQNTLENNMTDNQRQNKTLLGYGPIKFVGDKDE